MHLLDSPLTSGRIAMWKCMTILFISPILTTFVNGHDLLIYLLVIYTFVIVLLITFRNLCHEWTNWPSKVPTIKEKEVLTWYLSKNPDQETSREKSNSAATSIKARVALRLAVTKYTGQWSVWPFKQALEDAFVQKMAIGHPFAMWLLEKESGGEELPEMYSTTWFVQLGLALANQQQLVRGLKEHSPFITYRYSEYDVSIAMLCAAKLHFRRADIFTAWTERWTFPRCTYGPLDLDCHERQESASFNLLQLPRTLRYLFWPLIFSCWRCSC